MLLLLDVPHFEHRKQILFFITYEVHMFDDKVSNFKLVQKKEEFRSADVDLAFVFEPFWTKLIFEFF